MTLDDNKDLARRYQSAWERHDLFTIRALLADGCVNHDLTNGTIRDGIDFEQAACEVWHESFSEVQVAVQQVIAEGDRVTVFWLLTSVHDRPFLGIPATNKRVRVPGMEIIRVYDSKIAEIWRLTDSTAMMDQLRTR